MNVKLLFISTLCFCTKHENAVRLASYLRAGIESENMLVACHTIYDSFSYLITDMSKFVAGDTQNQSFISQPKNVFSKNIFSFG